MRFYVYVVWPSVLIWNNLILHKTKAVKIILIQKVHILKVMKTGSENLTFCVTFHNFSCLMLACIAYCAFTADVGYFCLLSGQGFV